MKLRGHAGLLLRIALALTSALWPASSHATTYYVSASVGSDASVGLSPRQPWKTLQRVNRAVLRPGDSVLLRRGDVWHEELRPGSSGLMGSPIRFAAYATGAKPKISGSDPVPLSAWQRMPGGAYCVEGIEREPTGLWRETNRLPKSGAGTGADGWWYEEKSQRVCLQSDGTPVAMEVQRRDVAIDNNSQSHVVYETLDLKQVLEGLRVFNWSGTTTDITLQHCVIATEPKVSGAMASAGAYVSTRNGKVTQLTIRDNVFHPFPRGLDHWGIYLVRGVDGFAIENNNLTPAGEDAITVWHSLHGIIAGNQGGGNGENTIDVKDSHDVIIRGNRAREDYEYNIVVHSVDEPAEAHDILVTGNQCFRGGAGEELSAGMALIGVQRTTVRDNLVQEAYGAGILVVERTRSSGNRVGPNRLARNGLGQHLPAVVWQYEESTQIQR